MQETEIVGCEIGDRAKLSVLGKAESCIPPVELEVFLENSAGRKPFLRIEICSGKNKPYCTAGGTYKIRGDARNEALVPGRLLGMFLDAESVQFVDRFRAATEDIESGLSEIKRKLHLELEDIYNQVETIQNAMNSPPDSTASSDGKPSTTD